MMKTKTENLKCCEKKKTTSIDKNWETLVKCECGRFLKFPKK